MPELQHRHRYFKAKQVKLIFYIAHLVIIFSLAFFLAKRWGATRHKLFWSSLIFHLCGGAAVGLLYLHYYLANDTWQFFNDAVQLSSIAKKDFTNYIKLLADFSDDQIFPGVVTGSFRSLIFVKLLSLFCLISGNSYWIATAYFSFIAFVSSWFLYHKIVRHLPGSALAATVAFLFFPSVVFWSSGIEKETLTLASLYFLAGVFLEWMAEQKIKKWFWLPAVAACFILWALKYYWAGVFFISAFSAGGLVYLTNRFARLARFSVPIFFILFVMTGVGASLLHPNFYLYRFLDVVVSNHDVFVRISDDNNLIHFYQLEPTVVSMLINSPWALVSGIFRPMIGEGNGWPGWLASIENSVILLLFFSQLISIYRNRDFKVSALFLAAISYCVVLCVFLALSTPNFGTLSRYRVGFLPFFVFMLVYKNKAVMQGAKKIGIPIS